MSDYQWYKCGLCDTYAYSWVCPVCRTITCKPVHGYGALKLGRKGRATGEVIVIGEADSE